MFCGVCIPICPLHVQLSLITHFQKQFSVVARHTCTYHKVNLFKQNYIRALDIGDCYRKSKKMYKDVISDLIRKSCQSMDYNLQTDCFEAHA